AQDVIIGKKLFSRFRILLDSAKSRLIIREKESEEDDDTISLIQEKLPPVHQKYTNVFSKAESDKLPPHCIYDYKIQLEAPLPNAFSLLYRQGTEELKATKQYLLENLEKGFIINSNSPFASPILFVKKADGKLRFCIDYRKLNGLTCYILTTSGVEADPDKIEPLRNWIRPTTVIGVKSYLGFFGFYRQFIRNFGKIAKPLTTITSPSEPFLWTDECENAFEELRRQLLAYLEIHDKELFAIVKAFAKWRPELASVQHRVDVYIDHRSLEYFMTTKVLTAKQVRWMELLSNFNFHITYTAGRDGNGLYTGFLHPLPVPDYPMQHLTMDFKEFPRDKHGYDSILVFMDRLSKTSVTIPCYKTTDARQMAQLFIKWIY
ncbi:hypothetical protein VF21_10642, partial [Pseudogymnoascus sp. 05NY08]